MADPKALMKEGEDALKTSMFKWEADHVAAGSLFEQAAKAYRAKGDGESAMGAYIKAAKSHLSKGGSGYESAAAAYQNAGQAYPPRAAELFLKSVDLYLGEGKEDMAIGIFHKAAESHDKLGETEQALALYVKAIDMFSFSKETRPIVLQKLDDLLSTSFRKLIAARRLVEASKCAHKLLSLARIRGKNTPQMILQIIILFLARKDIGAARQLLNASLEEISFVRSSEGNAAQELIDAFERYETETIKKMVGQDPIRMLDAQVVYLARELAGVTSSQSSLNAAASSSMFTPSKQTPSMSADKAALFSSASKPKASPAAAAAPVAATAAAVATPTVSVAAAAAPPPVAVAAVEAEPSFDFDLPDLR